MSIQPASPYPPQPIRRGTQASHETVRYTGWSAKMRRPMLFDNRLEFHHWLLLEGTPQVEQLCEQYPDAEVEGEPHVFDMWIRWRDGSEECRDVVLSRNFDTCRGYTRDPPGWSGLVAWGKEHGYRCRYITERELALYTVRILNWQRMLPFVKRAQESPNDFLEKRVLWQVDGAHDISMGRLTHALSTVDPTDVTAMVAKLLHEGQLSANLDRYRFGGTLLLSLSSHADPG